MIIRSSQPDPSRRVPLPGAEGGQGPAPAPRDPGSEEGARPHPTLVDRTEVSNTAHELLKSHASDTVPEGSLAPERLRGVLDRIRDGHYDRPEVLDVVTAKLRAEIAGPHSGE